MLSQKVLYFKIYSMITKECTCSSRQSLRFSLFYLMAESILFLYCIILQIREWLLRGCPIECISFSRICCTDLYFLSIDLSIISRSISLYYLLIWNSLPFYYSLAYRFFLLRNSLLIFPFYSLLYRETDAHLWSSSDSLSFLTCRTLNDLSKLTLFL